MSSRNTYGESTHAVSVHAKLVLLVFTSSCEPHNLLLSAYFLWLTTASKTKASAKQNLAVANSNPEGTLTLTLVAEGWPPCASHKLLLVT